MNIYIAGSFAKRHLLKEHRYRLQNLGHTVESSWMDQTQDSMPVSVSYARQCAERDLKEVRLADLVIVDVTYPSTTGGLHFETGYAFAKNKPMIIVGGPGNIFHTLIPNMKTWSEVYAYLSELQQGSGRGRQSIQEGT